MNGRIEVITGRERRRRWSDEEKLRLVGEACRPGSSVSQVARQRGISASQLFGWRRQLLAKGLITDNRSEARVAPALTFAPVAVTKEPAPPDIEQGARRGKATRTSRLIEVALKGGDRVRVEGCTDPGLVVRIVSVLRRA
jgi:transposase-like protein